jgi:hypothetical protein
VELGGKQYRYVMAYMDRHGRLRVYYRRQGMKCIPLKAAPGSPLFDQEYEAASLAAKIILAHKPQLRATPEQKVAALNSGVYFMRAGEMIKIGVSVNVAARLRDHQIGSAEPLHLMLVIPGNAATERELHTKFKSKRVHGEWFRIDDEIAAFVADQRKQLRTAGTHRHS